VTGELGIVIRETQEAAPTKDDCADMGHSDAVPNEGRRIMAYGSKDPPLQGKDKIQEAARGGKRAASKRSSRAGRMQEMVTCLG
jgi:hypothetical protein